MNNKICQNSILLSNFFYCKDYKNIYTCRTGFFLRSLVSYLKSGSYILVINMKGVNFASEAQEIGSVLYFSMFVYDIMVSLNGQYRMRITRLHALIIQTQIIFEGNSNRN